MVCTAFSSIFVASTSRKALSFPYFETIILDRLTAIHQLRTNNILEQIVPAGRPLSLGMTDCGSGTRERFVDLCSRPLVSMPFQLKLCFLIKKLPCLIEAQLIVITKSKIKAHELKFIPSFVGHAETRPLRLWLTLPLPSDSKQVRDF